MESLDAEKTMLVLVCVCLVLFESIQFCLKACSFSPGPLNKFQQFKSSKCRKKSELWRVDCSVSNRTSNASASASSPGASSPEARLAVSESNV